MTVATPKTASAPAAQSFPVLTTRAPEPASPGWLAPIQWVALAIFIGVPIFALLVPSLAGRVVWTVLVAGLPLFIVLVGYHRWRRICPLAFFARLPTYLRHPGKRKASPWLEANYYYITFSVFFLSLWLRLIATNGDGRALAVFFAAISLAALFFGLLYTGKTWCNYLCPLSFIEKIYTEPQGLRETQNSQCAKCTACKHSCPDINEENGYWKEIESRPKRFVYFAFPGVVFGFYFYYLLQSGSWNYYFSGRWTHEPRLIHSAFFPGSGSGSAGFFFLPDVPRVVASILTLALCGGLSFFVFGRLEHVVARWLRRRDPETDGARVRHMMFSIASFAAFVTFYTFAGAPTLRRIPWAPQFFGIIVVLTITLSLARRLPRTPKTFAEETLGRNFIKHWGWADLQPPKDLREAFLIHTVRSRESAKGYAHVLETYQKAVRETLASGYVTREGVQVLDALRNSLQIKQADHEKIMAALAEEERAWLREPGKQMSAEKRLQLDTYAHALEKYADRVLAVDGTADDSLIRELRAEYRVTEEEHAAVLDQLLGGSRGLAAQLAEELGAIEEASHTIRALGREPSPMHEFLSDLLRRRRASIVDRLVRSLRFSSDEEAKRRMSEGLCAEEDAVREAAVRQLGTILPSAAGERLVTAHREAAAKQMAVTSLTDRLRLLTRSASPYARAAALYSLGQCGGADEEILSRMGQDEHAVVREAALHLLERGEGKVTGANGGRGLSIIEKMVALRSAPIFSSLAPEDLAELARSSVEVEFAPEEALCRQGEQGNEVFVLLSGEVKVTHRDDGRETVSGAEKSGGFIGEMAVLDPAPRSATVLAGANGMRVLRLDGRAFRDAVHYDPGIAAVVIRTLVQRLRGAQKM